MATPKAAGTRRPDANLPPSVQVINTITDEIMRLMGKIDPYAANLSALDRKRCNSVGMKRFGFIESAFRISSNFPQYFPHWLTTEKFKRDIDFFSAARTLIAVCRSFEEKAWNITIEASDMVYTDALEYYAQVKDAAERRIDSAESQYAELKTLFKDMGPHEATDGEATPTRKKVKRDVDALLNGRKEGKIVIENHSPKAATGKRTVIDETFKGKAAFRNTEEGKKED